MNLGCSFLDSRSKSVPRLYEFELDIFGFQQIMSLRFSFLDSSKQNLTCTSAHVLLSFEEDQKRRGIEDYALFDAHVHAHQNFLLINS